MTQRVKGKYKWACVQLSLPDMGGTTGGEREIDSKSQPHVIALYHWPQGTPWGYPEDEVFWGYWLNDEVVSQALSLQEEPNAEDPRDW